MTRAGNVFRSFSAKWPASTAVWNGKSTRGEMVQSAEDYPVVAKMRDQFGNIGNGESNGAHRHPRGEDGNGYRILASRIFFKAFTADYKDVPPELAQQNVTRLDALAAKLKKFPGYKIRIVGHAVMIFWDNPRKRAGGAEGHPDPALEGPCRSCEGGACGSWAGRGALHDRRRRRF